MALLQADLVLLVHKPVIWHDWWLHFGVLGDPGPIFGTLGTKTNDTLMSRLGFLPNFGGFWGSFVMLGASTSGVLGDPGTILGRSWGDPGTILGHWRAQGRTL